MAQGWGEGRTFATLFVGGGTPSIYDGQALAKILAACRDNFCWLTNPEVTIEANPNTVSAAQLEAWRAAGANRLSLGVQSFEDRLLQEIGRRHDAQQAIEAVRLARQAGFERLNLDVIYGLPNQTLADWQHTLDVALELSPEHLSLYELSVEEGTPFAARQAKAELPLPDEEETLAMAVAGEQRLAECGYGRYEISNYARLGEECRHNLNYWQNGPYLGLGAGAVSSFDGLRLKNTVSPTHYMALIKAQGTAFDEGEALGDEASFRESVIMGLRMLSGVSLAALRQRYGLEPHTYYGKTLATLCQQGLIECNEQTLKLTPQALPLANQVLAALV